MVECCENPCKHHAAIYEKYNDKRFKRASNFVETELKKAFRLPEASKDSAVLDRNGLFESNNYWKRV